MSCEICDSRHMQCENQHSVAHFAAHPEPRIFSRMTAKHRCDCDARHMHAHERVHIRVCGTYNARPLPNWERCSGRAQALILGEVFRIRGERHRESAAAFRALGIGHVSAVRSCNLSNDG